MVVYAWVDVEMGKELGVRCVMMVIIILVMDVRVCVGWRIRIFVEIVQLYRL